MLKKDTVYNLRHLPTSLYWHGRASIIKLRKRINYDLRFADLLRQFSNLKWLFNDCDIAQLYFFMVLGWDIRLTGRRGTGAIRCHE